MIEKISSLLWGSIRRAGVEKEVLAALVIKEAKKVLAEKFGERIFKKIKILSFKNGILSISVLSSVIAQEIKINEGNLLGKINKKFGKKIVENFRFTAR